MTAPGRHPLDKVARQRMAHLMIIHLLTHPERVARLTGVTARYVRRQYDILAAPDMAAMAKRLEALLAKF